MPKDYYKILGVERSADKEEIKKAYRELAKKYHPDMNRSHGSGEIFIEITEAYEILMKRTDFKSGRSEQDKYDHENELKKEQ